MISRRTLTVVPYVGCLVLVFGLGGALGLSKAPSGAETAAVDREVIRYVKGTSAPVTRFSTPKEVFAHVHLGTVRRNGKNVNAYSDATSAGPVECYEYYAAKKIKAPGAAKPLPEWGLQVCQVDLSRKATPPPRGVPTG